METAKLYDEGEISELRQIQAPDIRIALDHHCDRISHAKTLKEVGRSS